MPQSLAARVCTGSCTVVATTLLLLAVSGATGFPEIALLVVLAVAVGAFAATLVSPRRAAPAAPPAPAPAAPAAASTPASVPAPGGR
ncbi:type III secretory pathway component EscV [Kitasatospora sp. MAA4]|uniref:hypothetical protein n=1 Tax=Kitasatospora sp. MAA4 TaxID=3035093 RepID=UPI002476585B|nr:hypothetical protein [Kitasatospora sp. MAA4]MDH6135245.1 type III secretory pathway component EscV [Kitasatospora sp. MAA4]